MSFSDMKPIFLLVLALSTLGCAKNKQSAIKPNAFFSLDSLLDLQVATLSENGYSLRKSVEMDGKEEWISEVPDSSGWKEEFVIIRDFDLNKPNNVGAYSTNRSGGTIRYELTAQIDAPVKFMEIIMENGKVSRITSNYFEDKSIYQHRRKLALEFENGLLKNYKVKGFQKMILKDTIHYVISGDVIKE